MLCLNTVEQKILINKSEASYGMIRNPLNNTNPRQVTSTSEMCRVSARAAACAATSEVSVRQTASSASHSEAGHAAWRPAKAPRASAHAESHLDATQRNDTQQPAVQRGGGRLRHHSIQVHPSDFLVQLGILPNHRQSDSTQELECFSPPQMHRMLGLRLARHRDQLH
jgi:hypothetical protein